MGAAIAEGDGMGRGVADERPGRGSAWPVGLEIKLR